MTFSPPLTIFLQTFPPFTFLLFRGLVFISYRLNLQLWNIAAGSPPSTRKLTASKSRAVSGTPNPFLPYNIRERTAVLPTPKDLRDVPFSVASRTQVGRAVASALLPSHLAATKNRYLLIRSFSVSQHDILASFEKATGGGKWTVRDDDVPDTEKHAQAIEKLGKGDFSVFPQLLLSSFYDRDTGIHFDAEPEFANPLLGLPDEDLDSLVGRAVKEAEKPSAL